MNGYTYPLLNRKTVGKTPREIALVTNSELEDYQFPKIPYDSHKNVIKNIITLCKSWKNLETAHKNKKKTIEKTLYNILLIKGTVSSIAWNTIMKYCKNLLNWHFYFVDFRLTEKNNLDFFSTLDDIVSYHNASNCLIILPNIDRGIKRFYLNTNSYMTKDVLKEFLESCHSGIKFVLSEYSHTISFLLPKHSVMNLKPCSHDMKIKIINDLLRVKVYFDGQHIDYSNFCFYGQLKLTY